MGIGKFVQKRDLLWTLGEIVDILYGLPSSGTAGKYFLNFLRK